MTSHKNKSPIDFSKLYYKNVQREFVTELLKTHGDFLLRRGGEGGRILSVNRHGEVVHFKFADTSEKPHKIENMTFPTLETLITYYYESGANVAGRPDTELKTPILNTLDLIDSPRIQLLQELGRGNFGQVWRGVLLPAEGIGAGEEIAVKMLAENTGKKERSECMDEARLMAALQHPHVVQLKGLALWPSPDPTAQLKLCMVLEYCNLGSLDKLLEKDMVGRKGKERSLVDTAKGMEYLHGKTIIHRDIACRNCLVIKGEDGKFVVKVADFGLSRSTLRYNLISKRRLPVYSTPPETLKAREWTLMSDVWSYGVLIQEIYNGGKNPYEAHYKNAALKQMLAELTEGFRLPIPKDTPPGVGQLAVRCMASNVQERPTMSDVANELSRMFDRACE